jgi:hypothetical protein
MLSRHAAERFMAVSWVGAIVAALVWTNTRVRDSFLAMVQQTARGDIPFADELRSLARGLFDTMRDMSLDHTPMMLFGVVALVLVVFMLRT